jgi:hypothetical protein
MYLPSTDGTPLPLELPRIPLVLDFPFISRRVAAQRSQFKKVVLPVIGPFAEKQA